MKFCTALAAFLRIFPSSEARLMCIVSSMALLGAIGTVELACAQEGQNRNGQNQDRNSSGGEVHLLAIRGNVSMLVGAGGNITVQAGDEGTLLVDTGLATMSDKVLEAIRPLSRKPLSYIINTDELSDHTGGNENIGRTGRPVPPSNGGNTGREFMMKSAYIIAFQTILDRMSAPIGKAAAPTPEGAWPNDTYSIPQKNISFNGDAVQIFHQAATTDGNSIVLFRRADVISAGDIFDPTQYPIIDLNRGGSLQGVLEGLNRLKLMAVPANHQEGGTMIVPGHGRLCDVADLAVYQQMVIIIRDRIQAMIKKGMTLEQVKAAKLTRDYDPLYGSTTGNWTTDMFVEAAYKSLSGKQDVHETREIK